MQRLREWMSQNAWAAWALFGLLAVVLVYLQFLSKPSDPYDPERMTEMVTIRFKDTGDELQMPRGRMEKELRMRGGAINPEDGIENPKTHALTGFPKSDWDETIKRLNSERAAAQGKSARGGSPAGPAPTTPPAVPGGGASPAKPK